eukprot:scaffold312310_cov13-Tisochrysis_lutea.AAC.1
MSHEVAATSSGLPAAVLGRECVAKINTNGWFVMQVSRDPRKGSAGHRHVAMAMLTLKATSLAIRMENIGAGQHGKGEG